MVTPATSGGSAVSPERYCKSQQDTKVSSKTVLYYIIYTILYRYSAVCRRLRTAREKSKQLYDHLLQRQRVFCCYYSEGGIKQKRRVTEL